MLSAILDECSLQDAHRNAHDQCDLRTYAPSLLLPSLLLLLLKVVDNVLSEKKTGSMVSHYKLNEPKRH